MCPLHFAYVVVFFLIIRLQFSYVDIVPSVRCQNATVKQQLENGVRFLDIRLSKPYLNYCITGSRHSLVVVHDAFPVCIYSSISFSRVLRTVYDFLDAHPQETVIMSLKHEGPFARSRYELSDSLWGAYIRGHESKWFLESRMPLLGEARGKIILFRRFDCPDHRQFHFGFPATSWRYNTTGEDVVDGTVLAVQDYCEVLTPAGYKDKTQYVQQHITRAGSMDNNTLFLNFTTAANFWHPGCWPKQIAAGVLSAVGQALISSKGRCGIMAMDFPDVDNWSIVKLILDRNIDLMD